MVITNPTNTHSHPSYRWFLGGKSQRNPQKVNSLVYKDYTLIENENGVKSYVSPEEKARLDVEEKLKTSRVSLVKEKRKSGKRYDSDSDSGYEIPVEKPKSCDDLMDSHREESKKNGSLPLFGDEIAPGDNGRINLPPYIVPLETSLTFPMTKQRKKKKKTGGIKRSSDTNGEESSDKTPENSSPDEVEGKKQFFVDFPSRKESEEESPEDAEVREIVEGKITGDELGKPALEDPVEIFPEKKFYQNFRMPKFLGEGPKLREKTRRQQLDPNPLRKMFGHNRPKKEEESTGDGDETSAARRYGDAALSRIQSDTESADHGSADKSSVSKLTSEKQPKKLMSGLFGSFRKGKNKDKVADNDAIRNPSSFEISVKEHGDDIGQTEVTRPEGIVYAELDMARSPGNVMRRDDEKTEYAEIIYPGTKMTVERSMEDLRKSRENLNSSRENLTEVDEAFSMAAGTTTTADGKKEAAV